MKKNKILILTGGTGGHVIPAVNFFNYIKNNSNNVFLLTDNRGYQYITNIDKKNIFKIQSSHLTGNINFKLLGLIKLLIGFLQSLIIYIKLRPTSFVSFCSYASFTPLICFVFFKFFFKTKLYLHEQNSLIGQTNKFFSSSGRYKGELHFGHFVQIPSGTFWVRSFTLVAGPLGRIFSSQLIIILVS